MPTTKGDIATFIKSQKEADESGRQLMKEYKKTSATSKLYNIVADYKEDDEITKTQARELFKLIDDDKITSKSDIEKHIHHLKNKSDTEPSHKSVDVSIFKDDNVSTIDKLKHILSLLKEVNKHDLVKFVIAKDLQGVVADMRTKKEKAEYEEELMDFSIHDLSSLIKEYFHDHNFNIKSLGSLLDKIEPEPIPEPIKKSHTLKKVNADMIQQISEDNKDLSKVRLKKSRLKNVDTEDIEHVSGLTKGLKKIRMRSPSPEPEPKSKPKQISVVDIGSDLHKKVKYGNKAPKAKREIIEYIARF